MFVLHVCLKLQAQKRFVLGVGNILFVAKQIWFVNWLKAQAWNLQKKLKVGVGVCWCQYHLRKDGKGGGGLIRQKKWEGFWQERWVGNILNFFVKQRRQRHKWG